MWIFLNNAFLSCVADRNDAKALLVRARFAGDIEAVFPTAAVTETTHADYRFRASLPRPMVAAAIGERLLRMTAVNFKDSVAEEWRELLYLRVWATMQAEQDERHPPPRRGRPFLPLFDRRGGNRKAKGHPHR